MSSDYEACFASQTSSGPLKLMEEHRAKNLQLRDLLADILPVDDPQRLNDCDLIYRFLIGKHWNVAVAEKELRAYVAMRREERIDTLLHEAVDADLERRMAPLFCVYGFDNNGFPILWNRVDVPELLVVMKQYSSKLLVRVQLKLIEQLRFVAKQRGVDRCCYILDLDKISMSNVNSTTLGFLRELMKVLQQYYPEIMRHLLIFNTGWAVTAAWKVLKPFVDARVVDKIKFFSVRPSAEVLAPYVSVDQILQVYGGTGTQDISKELIDAEVRRRLAAKASPAPSSNGGPAMSSVGAAGAVSSAVSEERSESPRHDDECDADLPLGAASLSERQSLSRSASPAEIYSTGRASPVALFTPKPRSAADVSGGKEPPTELSQTFSLDSDQFFDAESDEDCCKTPMSVTPSTPSASPFGMPSWTVLAPGTRGTGSNAASPPTQRQPFYVPGALPAASPVVARPGLAEITMIEHISGSVEGYRNGVYIGELDQNQVVAQRPVQLLSPEVGLSLNARRAGSPIALPPPREVAKGTLIGELLSESGHPVHKYLLVCDGNRRVYFVLRKSYLRRRVTVFFIEKGATVCTDAAMRHSFKGTRELLGTCVQHPSVTRDEGAWILNVNQGSALGASARTLRGRLYVGERSGQTMCFYGILAEQPASLLFTLGVGLCRLWESDLCAPQDRLVVWRTVMGVRMPLLNTRGSCIGGGIGDSTPQLIPEGRSPQSADGLTFSAPS